MQFRFDLRLYYFLETNSRGLNYSNYLLLAQLPRGILSIEHYKPRIVVLGTLRELRAPVYDKWKLLTTPYSLHARGCCCCWLSNSHTWLCSCLCMWSCIHANRIELFLLPQLCFVSFLLRVAYKRKHVDMGAASRLEWDGNSLCIPEKLVSNKIQILVS